ncbi:MAG: DegT/DnrJ/EryC1/StrS family aminotransferase [Candidatus Firestonebacteria bacterium]
MEVPIMDLRLQYRNLKAELDGAVLEVLSSGYFIGGPQVKKIEEDLARYSGAGYGIALNSGTDALYLIMKALGIKEGDEVIVPSFTFFATAETVSLCGAKPVFCDIRKDTFNIDPDLLEGLVSAKTRAVIPVHLYGQPAEMGPILSFAKKRGLKVIEDNAQAIGAEYRGRKTGSLGDAACLSFYPTKNLGGAGDGGMVLTSDAKLAEKIKILRDHGSAKKYVHSEIGVCSRLDELQAAVLNVKLKYLNAWNEKRRENAKTYDSLLKGVVLPFAGNHVKHVYHQYTVRHPERNRLMAFLKEKGITTGVHYPAPLHRQEAYLKQGYSCSLPVSERAAGEVLCLPIYPELTEEQLNYVIRNINDFC